MMCGMTERHDSSGDEGPAAVGDDVCHAALLIEYDGASFHGWSRQPGMVTVEGALLDGLVAIGIDVIELRCAGRTDAGVHASGQVASLAYRGGPEPARLGRALASLHGGALAVRRSVAVPSAFNARADALSRAYEYRVLPASSPSPLRRHQVLHHPRTLDVDRLQDAAAMVVGQHDFTAFTPTETDHVFFHRTVIDSRWEQRGDELVYCVRANAFLRHMVRVLVGTQLEIGRGAWSLDQLASLLVGAPRSQAPQTAPAHALCLVDVGYPHSPFG